MSKDTRVRGMATRNGPLYLKVPNSQTLHVLLTIISKNCNLARFQELHSVTMKEEGCGRPWRTCRGATEANVAGPRAEGTTALLLKLMLTWFVTDETLPTVKEQSVDMIWRSCLWSLEIVVQEMAMADKRRPLLQTLLISFALLQQRIL